MIGFLELVVKIGFEDYRAEPMLSVAEVLAVTFSFAAVLVFSEIKTCEPYLLQFKSIPPSL